jgi:hypothetical protein
MCLEKARDHQFIISCSQFGRDSKFLWCRGDRGDGRKSSALAWVWVVDGRYQHIHGQLRAKLRRIEADVESESVLPVFGRHDR